MKFTFWFSVLAYLTNSKKCHREGGHTLNVDIFRPRGEGLLGAPGTMKEDYWTYKTGGVKVQGNRNQQLSKQILMRWDTVFKVNVLSLLCHFLSSIFSYQIPVKKIETDIVNLKPKALIIGQGLWYARFYEKLNFTDLYKIEIRKKLDNFVKISKKVALNSWPYVCR